MLSPNTLLWTIIVAAVGWFFVACLLRSLWKMLREPSSRRRWSVTQGRITISQASATPTHPVHANAAKTGAVIRYRYQVDGKDYEGDACKIGGGKSRAMGLLAKTLLEKFPAGRDVDVFYDPANPAHSALDEKGKDALVPIIVFLLVFGAISAILTAHAIAGKMIMMSNGLPFFTLVLPTAALLGAAGAFIFYVVDLRVRRATAAWPTTQGTILSAKVIEHEETEDYEDSKGRIEERTETYYRAAVRFSYRIGDRAYSSDTWKPGLIVNHVAPEPARKVVARYKAGQSVQVYYDPRHPDVAVLEPANHEGSAVPLVAGVALGLAGSLFMWLMTHGHWVNAASGT